MKRLPLVLFEFALSLSHTSHFGLATRKAKAVLTAAPAPLAVLAVALLGLSPSETHAQGSQVYRDPQGRYSLAVPDGWNVASDNGNVTLSSGASWVTVATSNGAQPGDVNHQIVQQIQAQYKSFQILNEGDFQNNGHPAHGTNATGINPKGARVSVLAVSIGAGSGHYLILISSVPNDQAKQINGTVMQIAQSVRFAGE